MSLKKITLLKFLTVICAIFFFSVEMDAQTVTKTSNPGTTTTVDGCGSYCTVPALGALTFTQADFGNGCQVTDVNVEIRWAKTAGTCTNPGTGSSYHNETSFRLDGPDGTQVILITPGAYSGNATMSLITTTFDQSAGSVAGGATPTDGTYRPNNGNLNNFNGNSALGTWSLRAGDSSGGNPLCIDWWRVTVTTTTDNTGPAANCAAPIIKTLSTSGSASVTWSEINNSSTDLCGVDSYSISPSTFNCSNLGSNPVTLTVTDIYGNSSSCSGSVIIEDNITPTITCPATVMVSTNSGACNATGVALGTPTTSDNCSVTVSNNAPASYPIGDTDVTWTVTDAAGNSAQCTQTVTVTDTENPTISCPGPITLNTSSGFCSSVGGSIGNATGNDNCGSPTISSNAPAVFPLGVTIVTWTATDANNNTVQCTQTVIVQDDEAPEINCSGPAITLMTDAGSCTASSSSLTNPPATDNCSTVGDPLSPLNIVNNAPANLPIGQTLVTFTAQDAAGKTASCTRTITVEDGEDPTITCPATVNATANFGGCMAAFVNLGTPTTADNCNVSSVINDAPGAFPLGTTMVTWTVEDDAGNTAQCMQMVVITGDISVSAVVTDETCTDNGEIDLTVTSGSFITSVSWDNGETAQDIIGLDAGDYTVLVSNSNDCTASGTYTVANIPDSEAPVITICAPTVNDSADTPGCTSATGVALGMPTVTDNCGIASITNDAPASFFVGPNLVTWTVMDDAGNTAQCFQTVIITGGNSTTLSATVTDAFCAGMNGEIDLDIAGTAAMSISWDNGETSEDLTGLDAGDYTVTVINTDGCESIATYSVAAAAGSNNSSIAMSNTCGTCSLADGNNVSFINPAGEYLMDLADVTTGTDLGNVDVCINIDPAVNTCNGVPYLQRSWSVDVTNNEGADVIFYCTAVEMGALLAETSYPDVPTLIANLAVTGMDGGGEACNNNTSVTLYNATFTQDTPTVGVWSVALTTTGFSTFYVHPISIPLPVELSSFVGWNEGKENKLLWKTSSEENSSHFEVEKSVNGLDFERIGNVAAAGNSADVNSYDFNDSNPITGRNYYRLKTVDLDNTFEYSDIIVIELDEKPSIKGFPNPFSGDISFELVASEAGTTEFSVFDITGKQVLYVERAILAGTSNQMLKFNDLPDGTYIIKVLLPGSSESITTKVIKKK